MSTSRATGLLAEEPEDDDHRQKITAELKARGNEAFKSNSMREALALYTRAVELTPSDRAWAGRKCSRSLCVFFRSLKQRLHSTVCRCTARTPARP